MKKELNLRKSNHRLPDYLQYSIDKYTGVESYEPCYISDKLRVEMDRAARYMALRTGCGFDYACDVVRDVVNQPRPKHYKYEGNIPEIITFKGFSGLGIPACKGAKYPGLTTKDKIRYYILTELANGGRVDYGLGLFLTDHSYMRDLQNIITFAEKVLGIRIWLQGDKDVGYERYILYVAKGRGRGGYRIIPSYIINDPENFSKSLMELLDRYMSMSAKEGIDEAAKRIRETAEET